LILNIKIINKIDDKEPIKIKLILGELAQVIMNIINNSKDALLINKIQNPTIIIDVIKKENKAILTIEDNAGGIKEDILPHVFEPYFTTKHQSQGTGLGLYISFNIVKDSLKGNIYIKNTQSGAKTFIELPIENNDKKN
jgi:C4-dicarboxylate-specific signal transduction histidine kinase